MVVSDAARWDRRWSAFEGELSPARVLLDHLHLLPEAGVALEIACGLGANAELLAGRGLSVQAWDVSPVAIERLSARCPAIEASVRDVVAAPPEPGSCDVLVITRFLRRDLAPAFMAALRPGGVLFCQTFAREAATDRGPSNPDYRLAPGELLALFAGLRPLAYRDEGRVGDLGAGFRDEALLVAQRPF